MPLPSSLKSSIPKKLETIDALFRDAGLRTSRRGKLARRAGFARFEPVASKDLTRSVPEPCRAPNGVEWLPVEGWDLPWLWCGFSTRVGGVSRAYCADGARGELNLGFTPSDEREAVIRNRRSLAEAVTGSATTPLVTLRQFHSNLIVRATAADAARLTPRKADGQMTDEVGILLAVQTADCVPVLVADRRQRAVAAFHAGWRGTVKRIVECGIGQMRIAFGSRPRDLVAAIGPGIGACCYAVGEEVLSEFESQFEYGRVLFREVDDAEAVRRRYPLLFMTQRAPGHSPMGPRLHVDLIEANRRQLIAAGVQPGSIQVVGGCTQCSRKLFFSHRGSHGHTGRMMGVIGIR